MTKSRWILRTLLALTALHLALQRLLAVSLPVMDGTGQYLLSLTQEVLLFGVPAFLMHRNRSERVGSTRNGWWTCLAASAAGILLRGAISPVTEAWMAALGLENVPFPEVSGVGGTLLQVLALAVVPAVVEEALFRGPVMASLLDGAGRGPALTLTALFFALMHGSVAGLPAHLLVGVALTLAMWRFGRLWVPMVTHLTYNLSALYWPGIPLWGSGLCLLALLLAGGWAVKTMPRLAHRAMEKEDKLLCGAILTLMGLQYLM